MTDNPDRPDEHPPARRSLSAPRSARYEQYDDYASGPQPSSKGFSLRLISRALRRHWWQALLAWVVGSSALVALAYTKIKPTFDATSRIRVEMGERNIFTQNAQQIDTEKFLENQVSQITNPSVIATALSKRPELMNYPLLRASKDPEVDVKSALRAGIVPRTTLIQVEMSSQTPGESAAVVNAVVEAFLDHATTIHDESKRKQIDQLIASRDEQAGEVTRQRKIVEGLQRNLGTADIDSAKDRNSVSSESYRRFSEQLTNVEIQRIAAKAELDQLRASRSVPNDLPDERAVEQAATELFYEDPRVASLQDQIYRIGKRKSNASRIAKSGSDPSVLQSSEELAELERKKDELWNRLKDSLRRRVLAANAPVDLSIDQAIKQAETKLTATFAQEETLRQKLEDLRIVNKEVGGDALKLEFAQRDRQRAEDVLDKILDNLNQLQFEAKSPVARISREFAAKTSPKPNSDRRLQAMAAAPFVVGFLVTGLLLLLERRGARVSDPEELASRIQLQVIGVVPPLPQIRSGGPGAGAPGLPNDLRARRELDMFVQSLDHLRVALCARRDPWGRDRHCVLITSAIGSEGKTTLAAQLAERCVNAGLMTLLIDGDLRNPTLSRMLDAAENPGLINVLRGEVLAEDVVMVIGDAGGFHLLPAGSPRVDPSRLLQGDALGKLIAQARESFDMIIVDAPPVLPVPDALLIGRWTDGAVLAVRHDTSRFPLVERANRRLAHVGVPVIGAVVNGVRTVESSYGGYYSYGYGQPYGDAGPNPTSAASSVLDD